jgi:hypothetical protein
VNGDFGVGIDPLGGDVIQNGEQSPPNRGPLIAPIRLETGDGPLGHQDGDIAKFIAQFCGKTAGIFGAHRVFFRMGYAQPGKTTIKTRLGSLSASRFLPACYAAPAQHCAQGIGRSAQ